MKIKTTLLTLMIVIALISGCSQNTDEGRQEFLDSLNTELIKSIGYVEESS